MKTINNNNLNLGINENLYKCSAIRKEREFYKCYSPIQKKHLIDEGFVCLYNDYNPKTQKSYWIFKMTNALGRELSLWSENKPRK